MPIYIMETPLKILVTLSLCSSENTWSYINFNPETPEERQTRGSSSPFLGFDSQKKTSLEESSQLLQN